MKSIVLDSGVLITLSSNCLLSVIKKLNKLGVKFLVTPKVYEESVVNALRNDKHKLGGSRILSLFCNKQVEITHVEMRDQSQRIMDYANTAYWAKNHPIKLVHKGEVEVAMPFCLGKGRKKAKRKEMLSWPKRRNVNNAAPSCPQTLPEGSARNA